VIREIDDLKAALDEAADELSNAAPQIEDWEPWLVYFFEDLELLAASLDARHPDRYRAMLERLKDHIETRLHKGTWKNGLEIASAVRIDYWS
jgi:hypothetical protein